MRFSDAGVPGALVIYGAWSFSRVVAEAAECAGWTVTGFVDPNPSETVTTLQEFPQDASAIVAIGNNTLRAFVHGKLCDRGRSIASILHPSALVSRSATLAEGCFLAEYTVVRSNSTVGPGTLLNSGSVVSHDCRVGGFVTFGPNAATAGHVSIGARTTLGVGASVRPHARIGCDCRIGAGAAVVADIADSVTAVGVPAMAVSSTPDASRQSDWSANTIW